MRSFRRCSIAVPAPRRHAARGVALALAARLGASAAPLLGLLAVSSCSTLREMAALRSVDFDLDRVGEVRIAGVRVDDRRKFSDLSTSETARLAAAVLADDVPLDLVLHVRATNPAENRVTARLVAFDWTLFLEDREAVSGRLAEPHRLPPGEPIDVPVGAHLDLMKFFRGSARDAFDLALAIAGQGGEPKQIRLEAMPSIETGLGPIRYPRRIVIRREVGGR